MFIQFNPSLFIQSSLSFILIWGLGYEENLSGELGPIIKMAAEMDKDGEFLWACNRQSKFLANSERHICEVLTYKDLLERTEGSVGKQWNRRNWSHDLREWCFLNSTWEVPLTLWKHCIKDIASYNCPFSNSKENGRPGTCTPLMDGISLENNVPSSFIWPRTFMRLQHHDRWRNRQYYSRLHCTTWTCQDSLEQWSTLCKGGGSVRVWTG